MKIAQSSPNGLKTLWEKEKLLVKSNFSFSHSVFKRLVLQTRKNQGMFGKGLNNSESYDNQLFTTQLQLCANPSWKSLLKTLWKKEKMLVSSTFSISHNVFYSSHNKLQYFDTHLLLLLFAKLTHNKLQYFDTHLLLLLFAKLMVWIWSRCKILSFSKELN